MFSDKEHGNQSFSLVYYHQGVLLLEWQRRAANTWFILLMVTDLFVGMSRFLFVKKVRGKTTEILDINHHFGSCTTS